MLTFFKSVAYCHKRAYPPGNTGEILIGSSAGKDHWLFYQIIRQAWFGLFDA